MGVLDLFMKKQESIEQEILNSPLRDALDFLHWKMVKTGKSQKIGLCYQDVLFTIKVEPITDQEETKKEWMKE